MAIGMKDPEETEEKIKIDNLDTELDSPKTQNKNTIIIIAVVAVVVIVIIGMLKSALSEKETIDMVDDGTAPGSITAVTTVEQTDTATTETTEDAMNVGLPEFDPKENGHTSAVVYSASDYIKDLNGSDIPAIYDVANRTYVRDFVNYEAKRAILADGMEMYWLEIVYKDKPYRCQVPYFIFKDLDTTGICVVEIELLTLEGGEQIISFMQVVSDYSDLINE